MQSIQHADEAPDRCPECDGESWKAVKFHRTGEDGRMCLVCGRIERRCPTGHWVDGFHLHASGFCPPCRERRERYGVNGF